MATTVPQTDLRRWRLRVVEGDHFWDYLDEKEASQHPLSDAEKHILGFQLADSNRATDNSDDSFREVAARGYDFFQRLQLDDGHWACGYGGPSFLLAGIIFAFYITERTIPKPARLEMIRYIAGTVNRDGGWGLHSTGPSTAFGTILYYVALRLLGVDAEDTICRKARKLIHEFGGPVMLPQWGKVWLACMSMYNWSGVIPVPVTLWLLPHWMPMHPWRFWVQCRVVYLPMSYLCSNKLSKPLDPLTEMIRDEIYAMEYTDIDFSSHCYSVSPRDAVRRPHLILKILNWLMFMWTTYFEPTWLLRLANDRVARLVKLEDGNTSYNCIAPVNKALHMVSLWFTEGSDSPAIQRHHETIAVYLWQSRQGMTCSGTNGVQTWDTTFTMQALVAAGLAKDARYKKSMERALAFLQHMQLQTNLSDPYRQHRAGGWPFSTKSNGYIVSDCSAEAMKVVLLLQKTLGFEERISTERLTSCVDALLLMQNPDGGFGTYEATRGTSLLELLNPGDIFERIMREYSYPECTSAVVSALDTFRKYIPKYRDEDISICIKRAFQYIRHQQRPDGSWYGSWGICFTYATFFCLQALNHAGEVYMTSARVRKACHFLLKHQKEDGGWGEHWSSCPTDRYIQHNMSQVTNTSWAALALMYAEYPDSAPIERGLQLLRDRQQVNGEWLSEDIEGVFNKTCMIGYPNYKFYFPIWALGYYSSTYTTKVQGTKARA